MPNRPDLVPTHPLADGIRGLHQSMVSTGNQRSILMLVATTPGITNAEISRRTGLGAQTVSRFLTEMEKTGLIRRGNVKRGQPGQPATPWSLVYDSVLALGVSIAWRRCDLVLVDMSGSARLTRTIEYEYPDPEALLTEIPHLWREMEQISPPAQHMKMIVGGVALPEDPETDLGLLRVPGDIRVRWRTFEAARALAEATGLRFSSYGLGRAAAWAEHAGPGSRWDGDFLYIHIDEIISSGVIVGGAVWRSGKTRVLGSQIGRTLAGGRGGNPTRLQDIASVAALRARAGAGAAPYSAPELGAWIEDAAGALAWAFANTAMMIGMRHAVIGGVIPREVLTRLCDAVHERMSAIWPCECERLSVGVGLAGPSAPAMGAAYLPIYDELYAREPAF